MNKTEYQERIEELYQEFNELRRNPEFLEYTKDDVMSMFLIRKIAELQLYAEHIAKYISLTVKNDK